MKNSSITLVALAAFSAASAFAWYSYGQTQTDKSDNPRSYYVSATWRGEFKQYRSYVLDIPRASTVSTEPQLFDDYAKTVSKFSFPNGYIVQEFCEFENRRFVVGWKMGTGDDSIGTGRLYELTSSSGGIVPRLVWSTKDHRYRDCSFGKAYGKTFLAAVTQGDGYLDLWNVTDKTSETRHVPFYWKANNKATTMHFVEFADLDGDGNDETYFTATTPEFWRFGNTTGYQEWTLFRWTFGTDGKLSAVDDVGGLKETFVKRVKKIGIGNSEVVLVWAEGRLSEDGQSKTPFRIYAYYGSENGKPKMREVLSVPNKECKEFADFFPLGKNVPSFQLGCDNGETYVYEIRGDSPENFSFLEKAKISLNQKITENYASQRDALYFWDIVQTHTLFGDDLDGDGRDELLIGVNNTWLYKARIADSWKTEVSELFHIERVFPEPIGRLMIFATTADTTGEGFPSEPLIPYSPISSSGSGDTK